MGSASTLLLVLLTGLGQSPGGALGLEIERHLPGGVRSLWQRDKLGRPLKHEIWSGNKLLGAKSYTWEPNDRLKMIVDALHGPVTFGHHAMGNLAMAVYTNGKMELRMPHSRQRRQPHHLGLRARKLRPRRQADRRPAVRHPERPPRHAHGDAK